MTKLYYAPGACSLSPHIVLREAGIPFDLELVSLNTHKTKAGDDFYAVSPKGQVPVLVLDDGDMLTEGAVIVQYVADLAPQAKLLPALGTRERYHALEWLNFVATELHKGIGALFSRTTPDEVKAAQRDAVRKKLALVAAHLEGRLFLMGEDLTAPDAYLFTVLRWTKATGPDLAEYPSLAAFMARMRARPAVAAALEAEKLDR